MMYPVKTEVLALLRHLVEALQPFARVHFVRLTFESEMESLEATYYPEFLVPDITQVLCRVITFTPSNFAVKLSVQRLDTTEERPLQINIENTGVSLDRYQMITSQLRNPVTVTSLGDQGTVFEFRLSLEPESSSQETVASVDQATNNTPAFFQKLRRHMQAYATDIKNLEEAVAQAHSRREQVFLKKVNAIILAQLDREGFGVTALSRALATNRTQLYRRLKPLVQLAPSQYIRFVRLQKAKEYLENSDMTVGEVAFKVGFVDKSHFARAFKKQFGFNPSFVRNSQRTKSLKS